MFEKISDPIASRSVFYQRVLRYVLAGILLITIAQLVGMVGYHHFESMSWVDAFVNAAMILSGMGPMGPLNTVGGKIFAGCYALFSGLLFIAVIGFVFAPVVHRFFHRMHLDDDKKEDARR